MGGEKAGGLRGDVGGLRRGLEVARNMQLKRLEAVEGRLRAVGTEKVLARGYSVTTDAASGEVISDAEQLGVGQELVEEKDNLCFLVFRPVTFRVAPGNEGNTDAFVIGPGKTYTVDMPVAGLDIEVDPVIPHSVHF